MSKKWLTILKISVACAAFAFIVFRIMEQIEKGVGLRITDFKTLPMIAAVALMPVNYLMESFKWKRLLVKIQDVKLLLAVKSVLAGLAASMVTPNRIGDFAGRIMLLKAGNRTAGTMASVVGSCAQMLVIAAFGVAAFACNIEIPRQLHYFQDNYFVTLITLVIILIVAIILFFNISRMAAKIKIERSQMLKNFVEAMGLYRARQLAAVLVISAVRYAVFAFQFYLVLWSFGVEMELLTGLCAIAFIYCFVTIVPTFALAEWGVRGSAALFFLSPFGGSAVAILSATIAVWLINIGLPALAGAVVMLKSSN